MMCHSYFSLSLFGFQVSDAALAPVLRNAIEGMVRALQLRSESVPEVQMN